jgi:hypothetical protein
MKYTKIILIAYATFIVFMWVWSRILSQDLSKHHNLTYGYTYKVSPAGLKSSTPRFYYYYTVNGEKKYGDRGLRIHNRDTLIFLRRFFPVAYLPDNSDCSTILIDEKHFKDIGIPWPDSLQWVDEYIRK